MNDLAGKAKAIFLDAIENHAPEQWDSYLDAACAGDDSLRARVDKLLRARAQLGSFHEACEPSLVATTDEQPVSEGPGTIIGPYKLLEQIGEGGMGLVFVAEQQQPLKRRVALKIIKPGMDSRQVIARFEAERQALALMDHPNIAKVHDGGATPEGRPYFVMELVKGTPITAYCDTQRLNTHQRLELFLDVCHAVQHAHHKGIIHRDLKPSNVLVSRHDTVPVVKVIDFGIAKAISGQLTEKTVYTACAQMVGTPLYMSPEQAGLSDIDVDTRSDVYALGVLLYELLTGMTPFDPETLKKASYDELRRIIREDEPPRPSTRLSTLAQAARSTIAERRGLEPHRLSLQLQGELDWIVMKALEKDRCRRYESASALAADVECYVKGDPVHACPPSAGYLLKKFARRNKGKLAVGTFVLAALAIFAAGLGWIVRDWQARRTEAEARVVEALQVAEPKLREGNPHDPELMTAVRTAEAQLATGLVGENLHQQVKQLLSDVEMLKKLEVVSLGQAEVEEWHRARPDIGPGAPEQWHYDQAGADAAYERVFREYGIDVPALAGQEAAALIHQSSIAVHLTAALDDWAAARKVAGRADWKELLDVAREADPDPWRSAVRKARASAIKEVDKLVASASLAELPPATLAVFWRALRDTGATELLEKVLRQQQQRYPGGFWANQDLAGFLLERKPPRLDEGIGFLRAALAIRPQSPSAHVELGIALSQKGQRDEAIVCYRQAIRLNKDFALAHYLLGNALKIQGDVDGAIASYREAIRLKPDYVVVHNNLGAALDDKGLWDEAIASYTETIRLKSDYAHPHNNLGRDLYNKGKRDEAIREYRKALRLDPTLAVAHKNLGIALADTDKLEEAMACFSELVRLAPDEAHGAHFHLGLAFARKGRMDEAIVQFQEAVRFKNDSAEAYYNLGMAFSCKSQWAEAIASFKEAIRIKPDKADAHGMLGKALYANGQVDEAIASIKEAISLKPDEAVERNNLGVALKAKGLWAEAQAEYHEALRLAPDYAGANSNFASLLADCPDVELRDVPQAVQRAKKATQAEPRNGVFWNTLGMAQYRAGDWKAAVVTLEKSMQFRSGGDSFDWFFLAMAHWQLGDKEKAVQYFRKAGQWMDKNKPSDAELRRTRAEAAALLGIQEQPVNQQSAIRK
jgi:serine/threonine protein kinase/Flp pilus assembly protein TadD